MDKKLLLVDDEEGIRKVLGISLSDILKERKLSVAEVALDRSSAR